METDLLKTAQLLKDDYAEVAQSMCILHFLGKYLTPQFWEDASYDLNPQIAIKYVCEFVASDATKASFACTTEDVMLLWLTYATTLNMFVIQKQSESPLGECKGTEDNE